MTERIVTVQLAIHIPPEPYMEKVTIEVISSSVQTGQSGACEVCGATDGELSCIANGAVRGDCPYWERTEDMEHERITTLHSYYCEDCDFRTTVESLATGHADAFNHSLVHRTNKQHIVPVSPFEIEALCDQDRKSVV